MGAAIKRIKMRVLGILLIISLGCLSALDVESGRFEDEHLGVNEITKVPKTEVAEVVLPQTSLKVEGTARFFPSPLHQSHLVEKNIKRIKARKNWQTKQKREPPAKLPGRKTRSHGPRRELRRNISGR